MKIVVNGLGIIGASVSASLKRAGHTVLGKNRSREPIEYALAHGIIDGVAETYEGADAVILALPPFVILREIERDYPKGIVLADICGVKQPIEDAVFAKRRDYRYVGMHPMAGKETTGIRSSSATLFDGANLVLTRRAETDEAAFATVEGLARDMRFGRIVVTTAAEHDKMIALTSQLAHVVANAYVKSPLTEQCVGFTGGSYQDMTRVAGLDENVWTDLFCLNGGYLTEEIGRLISRLEEYRAALLEENAEKLRELLREGNRYHAVFSDKK